MTLPSPSPPGDRLAPARQYYASADYPEAEQACKEVLARHPQDFDALLLHGLALLQQHKLEQSTGPFLEAIDVRPRNPEALNNLGVVLLELGRGDDAASRFQQAIECAPQFFEAHVNLGNASNRAGNYAAATEAYSRALTLRGDSPELFNNFGTALQALGKPSEAIASYEAALLLRDSYAAARLNLAKAQSAIGEAEAAARNYARLADDDKQHTDVLQQWLGQLQPPDRDRVSAETWRRCAAVLPDASEAQMLIGKALNAAGLPDDAIVCYRRALALVPGLNEAALAIASIEQARGNHDLSAEMCQQVLATDPDHFLALLQLGGLLFGQGRVQDAIMYNRRATEVAPGSPEAHNNLANCHYLLGDHAAAIASYRKALTIVPELPNAVSLYRLAKRQICDWSDYEHDETVLLRQIDAGATHIDPFTVLWTCDDPQRQLRAAVNYSSQRYPQPGRASPAVRRVPKKRLTVGYLSPDFHEHPVGLLITELLEAHDRDAFRIVALSSGTPSPQSEIRKRVVRTADSFVDAGAMTDEQLAERIRGEFVDILIDLAGHTHRNRLGALALRPAPLQVGYLGYSGTSGTNHIDWVIADRYVIPGSARDTYTEKIYDLPGCYLVNHAKRQAADSTPSRAECGLPDKAFVYCCFNSLYKITPDIFDTWMRLLNQVPDSVLWLKGDRTSAKDSLRREAANRGIEPSRLIFADNTDLAVHLARHRNADLFLDTYPYNAASTAADALWMGLPILTYSGRTFVSRVAGSMLHTLGLPELATSNLEDYEFRALQLARDHDQHQRLKRDVLKGRQSVLFDIEAYRRDIERAYRNIWSTA